MSTNLNGYGVIWDLDGTMVDTMPIHFEVLTDFMTSRGIQFTEEDFFRTSGMPTIEIFKPHFSEASYEELHKLSLLKDAAFRGKAEKVGIPFLPGVARLLQQLKEAGFKQGIATGSPAKNLELVFNSNPGSQNYFSGTVVAEDTTNGKPHPEVFLKAAEKLEIAPEKCLVIEDGTMGIEGAHRAGMRTIAYDPDLSRVELFKRTGATAVLQTLETLSVDYIWELLLS
ncbi:HAD-IA family hydrolase [Candidatus Chlorohelix sp.]|uniref:HAD family hydrolase n=1 Tax=Candidatus Chlorohelix sp. TaxID=3139201 RepID=UPI0030464898